MQKVTTIFCRFRPIDYYSGKINKASSQQVFPPLRTDARNSKFQIVHAINWHTSHQTLVSPHADPVPEFDHDLSNQYNDCGEFWKDGVR